MTVNYREGANIYACNGILFNHESPRRGETFVTRKITRSIVNILAGKEKNIYLGNLKAKRDWGYAPEYVQYMWKMLQINKPSDYVLGTCESYTVEEFVKTAFSYVGLNWEKIVEIDPRYYRPLEPEDLVADANKARRLLNFRPKIKMKELVKIMVDADMRRIGLQPIGEGDALLKKTFSDRWWKGD
jgi:GDPmannose 4,6-dehydratase